MLPSDIILFAIRFSIIIINKIFPSLFLIAIIYLGWPFLVVVFVCGGQNQVNEIIWPKNFVPDWNGPKKICRIKWHGKMNSGSKRVRFAHGIPNTEADTLDTNSISKRYL